MEATALANAEAISRGEVPSLSDAIAGGVRWRPEPFLDGEHFDLAHKVAARGWGDCDDLAPWLAGELRASGQDEGARPRVVKTGHNRWHVVVQTSDGKILDPSRWAGMGKRSSARSHGVSGRIAGPFAPRERGALCVLPHQGKWWSRVDLPWGDGSAHLASHARARTPESALEQAIAGAIVCGEQIDSQLTEHARALGSTLLSPYDEADIGSIFGSIFRGIKKGLGAVTHPLAGLGRTLSHAGILGKLAQVGFPFLSTVTTAARLAHGDKLTPSEIMGAFNTAGPLGAEQFEKLANSYVPGSKAFMDAAAVQLSRLTAGKKLNMGSVAQASLMAAVDQYAPEIAHEVSAHLGNVTDALKQHLPGAGALSQSLLSSLTSGQRKAPADALVSPSGAVKLTLPGDAADGAIARQTTVWYQPSRVSGPLVMRF